MNNIQDKLEEALASCVEKGREPVLIIMHPETLANLMNELDVTKFTAASMFNQYYKSYKGIQVYITSKVIDIFIVDDRSWTEQ